MELTKHKKGDRQSAANKNIDMGEKPRLFIGGLKEDVEGSQLKDLFEEIGPVTDVFVSKGKGKWTLEFVVVDFSVTPKINRCYRI